jgi:steroid 5-alpha reductase family enzyme
MPTGEIGRRRSFLICLVAYLIAAVGGIAACRLAGSASPIRSAALADFAATVIVFAFSLALDNSSLYDPYWSIAPVPLLFFWAGRFGGALGLRELAVTVLLLAWAIRLTFNWARRWRGLADEDWRYADYRRLGPLYWPLSFVGFHLMPTVLVFVGSLALVPVFTGGARGIGVLDLAALAVTGGAILIESASDRELRRFIDRPHEPGEILEDGLWAFSRHPNYFGEVLFWWGLYLFGLSSHPSWWWLVIGPLLMTGLFLGVSVPMMDRRMLARHDGYAAIMARRSALVPWPTRRKEAAGLEEGRRA